MPGPYSTEFYERNAAWFVRAGYLEVRDDGSVWRVRHQKDRAGFVPKRIDHGKRHKIIKLHWPLGEIHSVPVQRLMWQVHKGDIPPGLTVNHKDGDPTNNRIDNLELMTQSEQQKHRYRVLRHKPAQTLLQERYDALRAAVEEALSTGSLEGLRTMISR